MLHANTRAYLLISNACVLEYLLFEITCDYVEFGREIDDGNDSGGQDEVAVQDGQWEYSTHIGTRSGVDLIPTIKPAGSGSCPSVRPHYLSPLIEWNWRPKGPKVRRSQGQGPVAW